MPQQVFEMWNVVAPPLNLASSQFKFIVPLLRCPPLIINYFGLKFIVPVKLAGAATMWNQLVFCTQTNFIKHEGVILDTIISRYYKQGHQAIYIVVFLCEVDFNINHLLLTLTIDILALSVRLTIVKFTFLEISTNQKWHIGPNGKG